jgi:glycine oxidase
LWPVFAAEVEQATGIPVHYRQSGALIVAMNEAEADSFQARSRDDNQVSFLSSEAAHQLEDLIPAGCGGALLAAGEAQVDTRSLGRALTSLFVRAGGTLSATEPVALLEVEDGRVVAVRTPFRRYEADAFVLAAGAWSAGIEGLPAEIARNVKPVKGEMLALTPPSGSHLPSHLIWGNGIYLVPRGGRLLVGATSMDVGFDTSVTQAARDWLMGRATGLLPALAAWEVSDQWAGLRPGSRDELPLLGPTTIEGLYAATGQYRNGILFAPAIAETVSRLVLEQKVPAEIAAFDPRRFA